MKPSLYKFQMTLLGGLSAMFCDTALLICICTFAICMDCYTAWQLSKRVKAKYPGSNDGKFKSKNAKKLIGTMLKIYALILLAYEIDKNILIMFNDLFLANFVAGIFCLIEIWSMLENESSCNDNKWAKIMQKIMVDKAERHFDIDLSDLKNNTDDKS